MTSTDRDPDFSDPSDSESGSRSSQLTKESDKATTGKSKKRQLPIWQESILLLVIALGLAILMKAFLVQAFYIPSGSMEPGLVKGDRILVQKVSYWGDGQPERGDVVVFQDPGGWLSAEENPPVSGFQKVLEKVGLYPAGGHLVKRVIGVPGDVIKCCDAQGRISVNGTPLDEDYLKNGATCNGPMIGNCRWTAGPVPDGKIFVMGDHRDNSADSSAHMCPPEATECVPGDEFVSMDLVVGKVFTVVWPFDHLRWLTRPDNFNGVPDASCPDVGVTMGSSQLNLEDQPQDGVAVAPASCDYAPR